MLSGAHHASLRVSVSINLGMFESFTNQENPKHKEHVHAAKPPFGRRLYITMCPHLMTFG